MLEQFIIMIFRAFTQNPARSFSMAIVSAIVALVAMHIIGVPADLQAQPQHERESRTGVQTGALRNCVTMPDGTKVCDRLDFQFERSGLTHSWACGFAQGVQFPYTATVRPPAQGAIQAARKITESVGLVQNFDILEGDFKNRAIAYALVRDHKRTIVYDSAHFRWKDGQPDWKELITLAHEIGHHLNGHTVNGKDSRWPTELEADRFAGFAVSRLDGTLQNALIPYKERSLLGSTTHPPRALRLKAVEFGWRHSENLKTQQTLACNTDWLGKPVTISSQSCRMAMVCSDNKTNYRIACQSRDGSWLWR